MANKKADGERTQAAPSEAIPGDVEEVLRRVDRHLQAGQPEQALEEIGRSGRKSDRLANAAAVCQIRLGNAQKAVESLRGLVVHSGIYLRDDVPPVFKVNFAAALLASGNVDGFLSTLQDVGDGHPSARKYREAYRSWRASLTWWERVKADLFGLESRPFRPDFPLGDLA